jgi:hypothetical protein
MVANVEEISPVKSPSDSIALLIQGDIRNGCAPADEEGGGTVACRFAGLQKARANSPTRHGDPFRMPIPAKLRLNVPDLLTTICITGQRQGLLDGSSDNGFGGYYA